MKTTEYKLSVWLLLTISFVEGACVMITELLGSKMIAPYYGSSLFVWASVLSVTLIGLAGGYFLGGYLSEKEYNKEQVLLIQVVAASFFVAIMPVLATATMPMFSTLGIRWGSFMASMLFLMPPILVFGSMSPLIIHLLSQAYSKASGAIPGYIFAVSTIGGVVFTLLTGFYFIPELGIRKMAALTSLFLIFPLLPGIVLTKRYILLVPLVVILLFNLRTFTTKVVKKKNDLTILYREESMLGQLLVADFTGPNYDYRRLFINTIPQTYCSRTNAPLSVWTYPHIMACVSSVKPQGSDVLLFGLGGGSLVYELDNLLKFNCDVVEIDSRMLEVAKRYFNYNTTSTKVYFDDARHFINEHPEKKYDVIIFDILSGETQPNHVFTVEGFEQLKNMMDKDALLIINYQGSSELKSVKALLKTMEFVGFKLSFYEKDDDFIIYASTVKKMEANDLITLRYNNLLTPESKMGPDKLIIDKKIDCSGVEILTDDLPVLDYYNSEKIVAWRQSLMDNHSKQWLDYGLDLVK